MPLNDPDMTKRQVHLLGEAFPEHFTITFMIKRLANGELEPSCSVISSPQNVVEHRVLHQFLAAINPGAVP